MTQPTNAFYIQSPRLHQRDSNRRLNAGGSVFLPWDQEERQLLTVGTISVHLDT